jgi:hypothetical protein
MSKKSKKQKEKLWLSQYVQRQNNINRCARTLLCPQICQSRIPVFHPDERRKWLRNGPCENCPVSHFCDTPCRAYLTWYDDRMTLARQLAAGRR